ncbi:hypothetical protein WA026_014625 [Henosepilachna vigintioctopunctata]|uniref:Protein Spindly n=1 Tax=Henosepilachna vigintioctopunctata TaxID=420089 RepID=A0AAW1VDP9_9CUCU
MASEGLMNPELIIKQLREELEKNQQFIHEYKRKIDSLENLEKEYLEEIEHLNEDKVNIEQRFHTKINEEKLLLMSSNHEEVILLQKELAESHSENNELKRQLNSMKKSEPQFDNDLMDDIDAMRDEIIELKETIENLSIQLNLFQKQCSDLEEINEILKGENECLQENLNLKKEELQKVNELVKDLQDNMMCLRMELDSIKNKPLDENSRGNSLFAEVNDSRVELLKKMKILMAKYTDMSRDRERLLKENKSLRANKTKMIELIQKDIEEYRPGSQTEIAAYKSTIDGLNKLVENYKQEVNSLKKKDNPEQSKDLKYYEYSLKCREKEIESLRQTLDLHSTSHIMKARNLCQLGREMANWKWKASELENQVQILTNKVQDLEAGYDKEVQKCSGAEEKLETHEKKVNTTITNDKKHSLLKKPLADQNISPEKIIKNVKIVESNECDPNIIDLTTETDSKEVQKSVHFDDNIKENSENVNIRKGPIVVTPLPISFYRKK